MSVIVRQQKGKCFPMSKNNKNVKRTVFKVLLHNVAAHNVNVTGRVCYLT